MITIVFMFQTLIAFFPRPLIPLLNENVGNEKKAFSLSPLDFRPVSKRFRKNPIRSLRAFWPNSDETIIFTKFKPTRGYSSISERIYLLALIPQLYGISKAALKDGIQEVYMY